MFWRQKEKNNIDIKKCDFIVEKEQKDIFFRNFSMS